jgi:hypothetical protein
MCPNAFCIRRSVLTLGKPFVSLTVIDLHRSKLRHLDNLGNPVPADSGQS